MFENTKGWSKLPKFSSGFMGSSDMYLPFAFTEVQEALNIFKKAGELTIETLPAVAAANDGCVIQGFPAFYGTMAFAPFDCLGDVLRGTRGVITDIYRRPDDVLAACDKYADINFGIPLKSMSSSPLVGMPLHKGADEFMTTSTASWASWAQPSAPM